MTHSDKVAEKEYNVMEKKDTAAATSKLMQKAVRTNFNEDIDMKVDIGEVHTLSESTLRDLCSVEVKMDSLSQADIDKWASNYTINKSAISNEDRRKLFYRVWYLREKKDKDSQDKEEPPHPEPSRQYHPRQPSSPVSCKENLQTHQVYQRRDQPYQETLG